MTEDETLATVTLFLLLVVSVVSCVFLWIKSRREDE